jgi:dihydroorotate dehydrogenase (fumarate)
MTVDLKTKYLGLDLANPLIVAACPLTRETYRLERLEQAGAAAAVMYSLFAEQVESDDLSRVGQQQPFVATDELSAPLPTDYVVGLDAYLDNIEMAKRSVSIPVIGSLNGSDVGEWMRFAQLIEQAGADALELNIYFVPTDPTMTGADVEEKYFEMVAKIRDQIKIPLSVKLGPFFSSLPNLAVRLAELDVNGLVLFNRFLQPDINIQTFEVTPRLKLSTRDELRLPLRWIAILRPHVSLSIAASTGAHTAEDVVKLLLAGADVVSMASALMRHGSEHLTTVLNDLTAYMETKGMESVDDMRGLVDRHPDSDTTAFERANYIKTIISYDEEPPP